MASLAKKLSQDSVTKTKQMSPRSTLRPSCRRNITTYQIHIEKNATGMEKYDGHSNRQIKSISYQLARLFGTAQGMAKYIGDQKLVQLKHKRRPHRWQF